MGAELLPYPPRPHQRELVAFLRRGLDEGRHVVVESGTGTGKTVSALAASLASARASGRRVVVLTRTNSQARQVMVEYRAIRQASGGAGIAVALQGRQGLCPLRAQDNEVASADAEELGVMCRDRMKAAQEEAEGGAPRIRGCPFYRRMLEGGSEELHAWARESAPDAETFAEEVARRGQCPYVLARALAAEAELVVAPYVYVLHPRLRATFFRWMATAPEDVLVVLDEAHNVPDHARELATARLGAGTLDRALQEAREYGDPTVLGAVPLTRFLIGLRDLLGELGATYLSDDAEDAIVPPDEFQAMLLSRFTTASPTLDRALGVLDEYAAAVREARRRSGRVPRSYVGTAAAFLRAFRALEADTYATLVERDGEGVRLVAFALDATMVTDVLHQAHATVHMSGTLAPLEEYRDTMGLGERASMATFPSPFPPENRLVLVDTSVTTRHEDVARDPALWDDIRDRLRDLRLATDRNMAVFVPSYETLHRVAPAVRARGPGVFLDARGETQGDVMRRLATFKASRGGTLVSVIGGRLSEGLDFPEEALEVVVLVGLPYPRPSAKLMALVRFHDRRFGRGWEWAVQVPMTRRLLQAAGRLIRTPTDRGVVVILDRRGAMLRPSLPDLRTMEDPTPALRAFFAPKP